MLTILLVRVRTNTRAEKSRRSRLATLLTRKRDTKVTVATEDEQCNASANALPEGRSNGGPALSRLANFLKNGTIVPTEIYARLAQLVEQLVYTEKVGSSSLSSRTPSFCGLVTTIFTHTLPFNFTFNC